MTGIGRSHKKYGGTGGMFVKKRTYKFPIKSSEQASFPFSSTMQSTAALIVGWDDVKCRPVFETSLCPTPISDEENCGAKHGTPTTDPMEFFWNNQTNRKKRKAYSVTRREAFFPLASNASIVLRKGSKTPPNRSSPIANVTKSCLTFATPPQLEETVCAVLDSNRKPITNCVESQALFANMPTATKATAVDGLTIKKRKRPRSATIKVETSQLEVSDESASRRQPSSAASVAVARAFFDLLDSTELKLDGSRTPLTLSKRCGRSQRRVNLQDAGLKREYENYSLASQQSGVTPIPLAEYACHRSDIFRKHEVFDGFLDE